MPSVPMEVLLALGAGLWLLVVAILVAICRLNARTESAASGEPRRRLGAAASATAERPRVAGLRMGSGHPAH